MIRHHPVKARTATRRSWPSAGSGGVGGGGTDLREGFARALSSRPRPDVVVALTDGRTPWPESRPRCRTVVGLFPRASSYNESDPGYTPDAPPDWARVVTIGSPGPR